MADATRPMLTPLLLFALAALLNGAILAWWGATSDDIAVEGGLIENLQVLMLMGAIFYFAVCARKETAPVQQFATVMCIAAFYLLVRELDFRALPGPEWMQWLSSKTPRRVGQIVILLVLFVYALINVRTLLQAALGLRLAQRWVYAVVGVLFAVAKFTEEISRADKNPVGDFALPHGQFWEELLELNADMMLFIAALYVGSLMSLNFQKQAQSRTA